MEQKKLFLKKERTRSVKRRHPWIFSGAIDRMEGHIVAGDLVSVYDYKGGAIGVGHYQKASISVRLLAFDTSTLPENFWNDRILEAWQLRQVSGFPNPTTNMFRLVHGEGDQLPGLIIDLYGSTAVIQFHDLGMYNARDAIISALLKLPGNPVRSIYNKSSDTLHQKDLVTNDDYLLGSYEGEKLMENSIPFEVKWETGQKTGFFLDQRDNRKLVADYAKDRNVLNAFSYTGGFSLYALKGGANAVTSMDISQKAIEQGEQNLGLLGKEFADKHKSVTADVMKDLKDIREDYDLIILDPPAFAKRMSARHRAIQAYKRLNETALRRLPKGGLLFTFSCSQVVTRPIFEDTILSAAINAGRPVRILHRLSQGSDHPVNIFHPESEYLKGLALQVE